MRTVFVVLSLALPGITQDVIWPPEGRKPDTIDYRKAERYAKLCKSAGVAAKIRKLAAPLKHKDPEQTFRNIHAYITGHVPHAPWDGWDADHKNFDRLLTGFDHNGCASHALLFANLTRACGIPAVYVKSNRHEWIRKYVATGATGSFSGHVFLEVFVNGKWRLLDAQGMRIWDDYDPTDFELPGGLLAYEKGWDHYAMVHSTQRDRYIEEAKARWKGFDASKLRKNENPGRPLWPQAYAITLSDEYKALAKRVPRLFSFDRGYWEKTKPKLSGNLFFVTAMAGRVEIPVKEAEAWLPVTLAKLEAEARAGKSMVRTRKRKDGTWIVLLSAPGWSELMQLIWSKDLAKIACDFAAQAQR